MDITRKLFELVELEAESQYGLIDSRIEAVASEYARLRAERDALRAALEYTVETLESRRQQQGVVPWIEIVWIMEKASAALADSIVKE